MLKFLKRSVLTGISAASIGTAYKYNTDEGVARTLKFSWKLMPTIWDYSKLVYWDFLNVETVDEQRAKSEALRRLHKVHSVR